MYDTNEIYHHGILGQKWGKKNGPPYPLDGADHSAAEKKAGWRKSLSRNSSNEDSSDFHFTDKQKKYIKIGVGVTATLLASYGAYKLGSMDKLGNVGLKGAALLDNWQGSSIDDIIVPKANIGSAKSSLAKSIIDKCDGKDSFGIIRIKSQQNSAKGHYIKWEIKDGECIFSDSLSGTVGADNYFNAIGSAVSRSIEFARVDGLAVNPFSIKDIVQNRI